MEFSAKQIATFIQGEIVGDENATVHTFAKIESPFYPTPNIPPTYTKPNQALFW